MNRIRIVGLIGALALASGVSSALASISPPPDSADTATVLFSDSIFVQGDDPSVMSFNAPGAGEVFLTLTDLGMPVPFESLRFGLTNVSDALVGLAAPGTLTLDLTTATTLYAEVFPVAQGPQDLGLYNLTATFVGDVAPVPLPPSALLLGGGLLGLLGFFSRWPISRRTERTAHHYQISRYA